ncbi:MAG: hypothetical protein JWO03_3590 [Bacteroidetes bacterium]|nr:hypothetical protein [Bacteroidota bacterium]
MKLKLAILPLCLIALNVFGFEGTISQSITNYNGSGNNVKITWYLGAHNCRLDMSATGKDLAGGNTVMVLDAAAKTLRTYESGGAGEKVYFEVNTSAISGSAPGVTVAKTTDTKKIQGYNCEKWTVTSAGASYDVWITKDIDFDAVAYKDFFKGSMEIQALAQQGVKGFPLLTESSNGTNAAAADKITKQTLGAETFSIPAGYKLYIPGTDALKPDGKK